MAFAAATLSSTGASDSIIKKGATIVGAYGVDATAYLEAIRLIESEAFPLEKLHSHTFGLEEGVQAIETLAGEVGDRPAIHVTIAPA